ncbi:MAG: hypothetical protein Pg6C_07380 [Treponemataceae bacterium]|nr:MAG: hypothetical protein Pg6C_07380 [Treponemataceae bacterium]
MLPNILIAAGIVWILLSVLSYVQFVHLRSIYNVLSEKGRVLAGQDKGLFRTKYRLFAAVSKDGLVTDARVLKIARFVIPSKILECPPLIGADLHNFDPAGLDAEPRIKLAAAHVKQAWGKLEPTLNPDIPSIMPDGTAADGQPGTSYTRAITGNKHLGEAENGILLILADEVAAKVNTRPLALILDALRACDLSQSFSTDEVIVDKVFQLRQAVTAKRAIDVPKVDGLVETVFRLIRQRESEARYRRES